MRLQSPPRFCQAALLPLPKKSNCDQRHSPAGAVPRLFQTDRPNKTARFFKKARIKVGRSADMADSTGELEPIPSTQSLQLDLPPSCVEFCPAHPSYFLVGTYNLQKDEEARVADDEQDHDESQAAGPAKPQTRNGSIVAFRLTDNNLWDQPLAFPGRCLLTAGPELMCKPSLCHLPFSIFTSTPIMATKTTAVLSLAPPRLRCLGFVLVRTSL